MTDAATAPGRPAQGAAAIVLAIVFLVMPSLAVMVPLAMAPLFIVAALGVFAAVRGRVIAAARPLWPLIVLWAALSLWATLSAAWSILPLHSFLEGLRLLAEGAGGIVLIATGWTLAPHERRRVGAVASIGLGLGVALLLFEATTDAALTRALHHVAAVPLSRFDRGATVAVLTLWPVLVVLARRRTVECLAISIATFATMFMLDSQGAALAVVGGYIVFGMALGYPKPAAAAVAVALIVVTVGLPITVPPYARSLELHQQVPAIKWSGIHRLLIWRFTADRVAEKPALGWGMDASRAIPGGKTKFATLFPEAQIPGDAEALPLHPHDAALEWEVELGAIGAALALALVLWGIWRVGFTGVIEGTARAGMLSWAGSALVIALLAYGAWQAWWISTLFLTAALFTATAEETPPAGDDTRAPNPL